MKVALDELLKTNKLAYFRDELLKAKEMGKEIMNYEVRTTSTLEEL